MATKLTIGLCFALLLLTTGCFSPTGYVYTRTVAPYSFPEEQRNQVATKSCTVDITQIKEPVSRFKLTVVWTNRAVQEAMKKAKMSEVRYADLITLSVLNKTYERRRLVFYGE
ncbi:MAG: hypothetical protein WCP12_03375 [bacterium]